MFAKCLGLNPSTYNYYENNRVAPAEVLLKISKITGVSMEWLLTGNYPEDHAGCFPPSLFNKITSLLTRDPKAAATLEAFVDVLLEKNAVEIRHPQNTPQPEDEFPPD